MKNKDLVRTTIYLQKDELEELYKHIEKGKLSFWVREKIREYLKKKKGGK